MTPDLWMNVVGCVSLICLCTSIWAFGRAAAMAAEEEEVKASSVRRQDGGLISVAGNVAAQEVKLTVRLEGRGFRVTCDIEQARRLVDALQWTIDRVTADSAAGAAEGQPDA